MAPDREVSLYINSPGGSFTSLMAMYDTMQFVPSPVATFCLGQAASAAAVLVDEVNERASDVECVYETG